jgi:hypothetical protein
MGAITRAAANNITTGGVILPAGINDASVASVTALAQVSAGDGITLISSQTASASASISFTTGIDSTYRTYMFKFINIYSSAGANFNFQANASGGSGFNETITSAMFRAFHIEVSDASGVGYQTSGDQAQGTSYNQIFFDNMSNDSDSSGSGTLYLFNPSSTTYVKHFISNTMHVNSTGSEGAIHSFSAGYFNITSAISEIDFKFPSGTITGTIHMYGIA